MEFSCAEIESLDLDKPGDVVRAFENLVGECIELSPHRARILTDAINSAASLVHDQFNEMLLVAGQVRVTKHFFEYFFSRAGHDGSAADTLRSGIRKFCGFAMLCYGNFRFAYRALSHLPERDFVNMVTRYDIKEGAQALERLKQRNDRLTETIPIPRSDTWFNGYISATSLESDLRTRSAICYRLKMVDEAQIAYEVRERYRERFSSPAKLEEETARVVAGMLRQSEAIDAEKWKPMLEGINRQLEELKSQMKATRYKAKANTDTYLTWEHMDIYFATSMRHRWEYEACHKFISEVTSLKAFTGLGVDGGASKSPLRYFDPTQSFLDNRIDKGLVEGLMLNRASLTVYLAQEGDTLGKDSELASTLAQGKPVVAYVPQVDESYWQNLPKQPLDFFLKRVLLLIVDDAFKDEKCFHALTSKYGPDALERLGGYVDRLTDHVEARTFCFVGGEDELFKQGNADDFGDLCNLLGTCEQHYLDRRADLLRSRHPLGVQVNLRNGVANGVLVVRDPATCAELIAEILSNKMSFDVVHEKGVTELRERRTGSPYRVVTDDPMLTNSFWNFYLTERKRQT